MSEETTPKPGLLAYADSPKDAAAKLAGALYAETAADGAPFGELFNPPAASENFRTTTL